ncbi:MAG TPA: hypothetical protein VK801_16595 [Caulobacteraceae bacterium]|nr:hypothetical protein [Caulobacteraceae bacterium]
MKALPLLAAILVGASAAAQAGQKPQPTAPDAKTADLGEPLPSNAPKDPYELAAWCYGALDQYLYIYENIIPQLQAIDQKFGSSVKNEARPYADDMAAAHDELKVIGAAVEAAERASPQVISPRGAAAVKQGRSIWAPAEQHTHRELARAWLSWALPDRCASNARELKTKSDILGQALKYNAPSATSSPRAPVSTTDEPPPPDQAAPPASPAPHD